MERVAEAMASWKPRVLDGALQASCDNVRQHVLLAKVATRINDADVRHLVQGIVKASGHKGVPQGGVCSPRLSKLYHTEVDRRLERAKEVTRRGQISSVAPVSSGGRHLALDFWAEKSRQGWP